MKNIMTYKSVVWMALFFSLVAAQSGFSKDQRTDPIRVAVSILPQGYFVERIGGQRVRVHVLVLPGRSPATYAPTPSQISNLAKSHVYFRIGVPFENLLLPRMDGIASNLRVVDTRKGIKLRKMIAGHHDHDEGKDVHRPPMATDDPGQDHHDQGYDPHIWLDPNLVKKQAATICETLMAIDPDGAAIYRSNLDHFVADLEALHQRMQKILKPFANENLYVFHPSFGYLADAYGFRQRPIEVEGKSPKGKDLYQFIQMAKQSKARTIFVQPQFDQQAAMKIAKAIQGRVIPLNPLAENYIENMEHIALIIAGAVGGQ
jgi:zinc transport system substrate-binding protein